MEKFHLKFFSFPHAVWAREYRSKRYACSYHTSAKSYGSILCVRHPYLPSLSFFLAAQSYAIGEGGGRETYPRAHHLPLPRGPLRITSPRTSTLLSERDYVGASFVEILTSHIQLMYDSFISKRHATAEIPLTVVSFSISHGRERKLLERYFEQLVLLEHHMQVGNNHQHTLYALIDLLDYS